MAEHNKAMASAKTDEENNTVASSFVAFENTLVYWGQEYQPFLERGKKTFSTCCCQHRRKTAFWCCQQLQLSSEEGPWRQWSVESAREQGIRRFVSRREGWWLQRKRGRGRGGTRPLEGPLVAFNKTECWSLLGSLSKRACPWKI